MKTSVHQEDVTINMNSVDVNVLKHTKHKIIILREEIDNFNNSSWTREDAALKNITFSISTKQQDQKTLSNKLNEWHFQNSLPNSNEFLWNIKKILTVGTFNYVMKRDLRNINWMKTIKNLSSCNKK